MELDKMQKTEKKIYTDESYDAERAFYGCDGVIVKGCRFSGPVDGESAFKEASGVEAYGCRFELRYPFWHNRSSVISGCEMTEACRAPLWYSESQRIENSVIRGPKAIRECRSIDIEDTVIVSDECGWDTRGLNIRNSEIEGFYFAMRSTDVTLADVKLKGKYSLQYIKGGLITDSVLDTKDSLWHAKGVRVVNSVIKGEYLAWYSEDVTFENCVIIGTQPFCYCKGLCLIDCEMRECDLSFEKSEVTAEITSPVVSIKNPASGRITVPSVGEIIMDDPAAKCVIAVLEK